MVNKVEYIMPAVHEKMMTPAALRVRAMQIIPDCSRFIQNPMQMINYKR
jgi:hypothetical protein